MAEVIGWGSSLILLLTIARQIHKQWRDKTSAGVSVWLFVGQLVASGGFLVYSVLVGNRVFIVTNALMAASAIAGWVMVVCFRRKGAGR
jgi:MtN3 and saliva related transmembrane protein